jgi:hypothetical protein
VVQTLLQHGPNVAARDRVGDAGVPLALAWRCARECRLIVLLLFLQKQNLVHAMCVRASVCMPCLCAPWYAWRCVHAIVRVCVAVPRQQRAAR